MNMIDPHICFDQLILTDNHGVYRGHVTIDTITQNPDELTRFTGHFIDVENTALNATTSIKTLAENLKNTFDKKESNEMKEFKVGDRVCIVTDGNYKEGLKNTHGVVQRIYTRSSNCPYGIKIDAKSNPRSLDGVFWFNACDLRLIPADVSKNSVYSPTTNPDIRIRKIIYNDRKTIIIWADKSKTIVSCKEDDIFDPYAGFCAAVTKKLFGSTSKAKKFVTKVSGVDVISEPEEGEE